ncbi:hypothetical protein J6590_004927 [Homalodisca vitripennis]|nr:hypothetical protein J6590_004927 [Homalodisca vitripennis]
MHTPGADVEKEMEFGPWPLFPSSPSPPPPPPSPPGSDSERDNYTNRQTRVAELGANKAYEVKWYHGYGELSLTQQSEALS